MMPVFCLVNVQLEQLRYTTSSRGAIMFEMSDLLTSNIRTSSLIGSTVICDQTNLFDTKKRSNRVDKCFNIFIRQQQPMIIQFHQFTVFSNLQILNQEESLLCLCLIGLVLILFQIFQDIYKIQLKMKPANELGEKRGELFVLYESHQYKLKDKKLQKILGFAPMYDGTMVVLAQTSNRDEGVIHFDKDGKFIKHKMYHDTNFFPYVIPTEQVIIWVDNDNDKLYQWNLKTDQYLQFGHKYDNDLADSHQVFYFPQTKLVCVGQWGRHDSNYLRFTYYQFPLKQNSEPVYTWGPDGEGSDKEPVWTYQYTIRRANLQTKFVWWKCAMKENIQLRTFQIFIKDGKYTHQYIKHVTPNVYKTGNGPCQLSVGCIWQMKPKKYFIVSISDRPHQNEDDFSNSLFVFEENNNIFRQSNIIFQGKFRFQYIHYYSFGRTAMIRGFDFLKGVSQTSPIYYIDNENEVISAKQEWKCSHLNKFTLPGYDGNMIIDAEYENGDVTQIKSRKVKVVDMRQLFADLVVQNIPQVDEDLVQEVIELLTSKPAQ